MKRLNVLTRHSGRKTCGRNKLDNFLRSKISFVDDEKDLNLVFSLSHLSPAFCVLAFGYELSSGAFLVEAFLRPIPKFRICGLAGFCTLMLRWAQNQYILWRCGVKYDNFYVTAQS